MEAIKNFMPYTNRKGHRRTINMALVFEFGPITDDFGDPTGEAGTELICAIPKYSEKGWDTAIFYAQEPPEHFLGRRSKPGGHQ